MSTDKMQDLIGLLPASGTLEFEDFMARAREGKLAGSLWLRAKHKGLLFTWIDEHGHLHVSRNPKP